jgi:ribosomal protein S18 acetylase RimI-like enzyme
MAAAEPALAVIRAATSADAPALARLFRESRAAAMPWLPVLHAPAEDLAWMAGQLADPARRAWVAEDGSGGAVLGFVVRRSAWIDHLYVHPGWRRRGLGSRLLALAAAAGPPPLRLHVFEKNHAARAFYERHGFRAVAFGDGSTNEEREPDVLYKRAAGGPGLRDQTDSQGETAA